MPSHLVPATALLLLASLAPLPPAEAMFDCAATYGPGYAGGGVPAQHACASARACDRGNVGVGLNGDATCGTNCDGTYGRGYLGTGAGGVDACVDRSACTTLGAGVNGQPHCYQRCSTGFGPQGVCVTICPSGSVGAGLNGPPVCFSTTLTDCWTAYGPGYVGTGLAPADACVSLPACGPGIGVNGTCLP